MGFLRKASENFIGLIFPSRCIICERPTDSSRHSRLCVEHAGEIIAVEPPVCSKCGRKMFGVSVERLLCEDCRSTRVYYDAGYSPYLYRRKEETDRPRPLSELIRLFKYGKGRHLRSFLGGLLLNYVREHADMSQYDAIVPVPLHWRRYFSRGFNQATDLARPLSRHFRISILKRSLRRVRHTRPQVSLPPKERKSNIVNAFKVTRPARVAGKKLLLIDDVITTGATLNECARVLKDAGASEVTILTLAHPSDLP